MARGAAGPTPALSDAQLLAAIRSDLARSPFQGEGHRKVHARLRILAALERGPEAGRGAAAAARRIAGGAVAGTGSESPGRGCCA